jgi:hypothetical protein
MKDLRSRKSVLRGMLWVLGSEKEEVFNGRHIDDATFKVRMLKIGLIGLANGRKF